MLIQAILLGLVAFIAQSEYALGTSLLSRPIVTGLFTGIVLGDVKAGIIMGVGIYWLLLCWRGDSTRCSDRRHFGNGLCDYRWCWNRNGVAARFADCHINFNSEKYLSRYFDSDHEPKRG